MYTWLVKDWHWPAAASFAALFLFAMVPVVGETAGLPLALVMVQLPVYMVHQWEEHRGDRFRLQINATIGGGREVLTRGATFWINALGVWGVDLTALYLAWLVTPAAGLAAGYLALVNGVLHAGQGVLKREYNPGLVTATLMLLPLGGWCVWQVGRSAVWEWHAIGLGAAVGVHAAIVAWVMWRLRGMKD
jgi:hypothetical protein